MWWSGVASTTSRMMSLGGVARRGLGDGHVMMNMRRVVAPSVVVVASMEDLVMVLASIYTYSGDDFAEDGGGELWSLGTRRYLWI